MNIKRISLAMVMIGFTILTGCQKTNPQTTESSPSIPESVADVASIDDAVQTNTIQFPAYPTENPNKLPYYDELNSTQPFIVQVDFPKNWEITKTMGDETIPIGELFSKVFIYDKDKLIGYIGFDIFEPYTEEVEPEQYYKTVYPKLRLPRVGIWDPYTAIKTTEVAETGIVDIWYLDPNEIEKHPGAMADVPQLETTGILSYDKELKVYIGIAFMPDTIDKVQAEMIAKTISLSLAE